MAIQKYSSYADINRDLEVLKLEREIYYRKTLLSVEKTKDSILPIKSISYAVDTYRKVFSGATGTIIKMIIPLVVNWFINKKRGD